MLSVNTTITDSLLTGFDEVSNMVTRVRSGKCQVTDEEKLNEREIEGECTPTKDKLISVKEAKNLKFGD